MSKKASYSACVLRNVWVTTGFTGAGVMGATGLTVGACARVTGCRLKYAVSAAVTIALGVKGEAAKSGTNSDGSVTGMRTVLDMVRLQGYRVVQNCITCKQVVQGRVIQICTLHPYM